jgi:hypothetical protein
MVTLHFTSSLLPGAALIRGATFSTWHHCAIEIDGFVYEAKIFGGVICRTVEEFKAANKRIKSFSLECKNEEGLKAFLNKVLGMGYDWAAIFGILSHSDFDITHRWHCAELVAECLREYVGIELPKLSSKCTPRDILFAAWSHRLVA